MSYGGGGKESPVVGELELPRVARVPAREGENRPRVELSGLFHSGGDVELPSPRGSSRYLYLGLVVAKKCCCSLTKPESW